MFSSSDRNMIAKYCEISRVRNLIEEQLLLLNLFSNDHQQRLLIQNRCTIQYIKLEKRCLSNNDIDRFVIKKTLVRQHSF